MCLFEAWNKPHIESLGRVEGGKARKSHSRDLGDAWRGVAKPVKTSMFFKALPPPQQNSSPAVPPRFLSPSQPSSTQCPLSRSCMAWARPPPSPPSLLSPPMVTRAVCLSQLPCGLLKGRSCTLFLLVCPSPCVWLLTAWKELRPGAFSLLQFRQGHEPVESFGRWGGVSLLLGRWDFALTVLLNAWPTYELAEAWWVGRKIAAVGLFVTRGESWGSSFRPVSVVLTHKILCQCPPKGVHPEGLLWSSGTNSWADPVVLVDPSTPCWPSIFRWSAPEPGFGETLPTQVYHLCFGRKTDLDSKLGSTTTVPEVLEELLPLSELGLSSSSYSSFTGWL